MSVRRVLAVLVASIALACEALWARSDAAEKQQQASGEPSHVLTTAPVLAGKEMRYEVVLAACGKRECPLQIRLLDGAAVRDTASLEWASVVETPRRSEQFATVMGIGDPLEPPRKVSTWSTGEGEDAISTLVQTIRLPLDQAGLLVHQSGGEEHVKRMYYLFVASGNRLIKAWQGWEGQGYTSSVDWRKVQDRSELLFWRFTSADGVTEDWQVSVLRWNAALERLVEAPGPGPSSLSLVTVAGAFRTAADASRYLSKHGECLRSFHLIRMPGRSGGAFAVAGITARPDLAASAAAAARKCTRSSAVRVLKVDASRR